MGLLLHRWKQSYKIAVKAETVVPTFAPEEALILFRQRTRSWDLCTQRKFMSFFKMLISDCASHTLVLKPFLLYELICIMFDWIRLFLIVMLLHTRWVHLPYVLCVMCVFC
jgi:hypothetical protein